MTAWSFATLQWKEPLLMDALASAALRVLPGCGSQELSNTAWAFATLALLQRPLMAALSARSLALAEEFRPQEVANTSWAHAVLQWLDPALCDALAEVARRTLSTAEPRHLSGSGRSCWKVLGLSPAVEVAPSRAYRRKHFARSCVSMLEFPCLVAHRAALRPGRPQWQLPLGRLPAEPSQLAMHLQPFHLLLCRFRRLPSLEIVVAAPLAGKPLEVPYAQHR